MATVKTAYNADQSAELVAAYKVAATEADRSKVIETFAVKFGKNVKSVIAKLSREGVYIKKEKVAKDGNPVQAKEELADAIGKVLGMTNENDVSSLAKANKSALQAVFKALANSKPLD